MRHGLGIQPSVVPRRLECPRPGYPAGLATLIHIRATDARFAAGKGQIAFPKGSAPRRHSVQRPGGNRGWWPAAAENRAIDIELVQITVVLTRIEELRSCALLISTGKTYKGESSCHGKTSVNFHEGNRPEVELGSLRKKGPDLGAQVWPRGVFGTPIAAPQQLSFRALRAEWPVPRPRVMPWAWETCRFDTPRENRCSTRAVRS